MAKMPKCVIVIAAHPIQQRIMDLVQGKGMDDLSLRAIAAAIGDPKMAPQKIKHHIGQLVKYGFLDIVGGKYRLGRLPR